ncbi:MAG: type II toxin-antitoxin system VapC family toxin [Chloroflexia bacterium]
MNNSLICVDANVVIGSLVPSPLSDKAKELLVEASAQQITLIAPALLAYEVASVLRRLVYLRALTPEEGEVAFSAFVQLPLRLTSRKAIIPLAWQLAKQFNRPRAYDTSYLAVAQVYDCVLWTADEKLYNAIETKLPWVKWLGDYARQPK